MPMYVCQLWSTYAQTSMKRLPIAYKNAHRVYYSLYPEM